MKISNRNIRIIVSVARILLALAFIFSGFVKSIDPHGTAYKIEDYTTAFGISQWIPAFFYMVTSLLLSVGELILGLFLLLGLKRKITSTLLLILLLLMTPLTLYLALADPVSDCGCFGDALLLTNWQTFFKNIVLLGLSVLCFKFRTLITPCFSFHTEWISSLYIALFSLGLALYCLYYLPVLDFRPYRIGASIQEEMELKEGETPPVLETYFLLEKNGEKREFTASNYPDSTWTFLSSRLVEIEKGATPRIQNFSLQEVETKEDLTDKILLDKSYSFWLIMPRIVDADDSNIDLINEVYDYSTEHGYSFYAITSSSSKEIDTWREKTGAEYPFLLLDEIELKTMVRSNPGLILVKEGKIINKWSHNDIPDEYALTGRLENIDLGNLVLRNNTKTIIKILSIFVIPLLLILFADVSGGWIFKKRN